MRIVGGALKGRTLYGFRGEDIRPTSDNARESLFNILGDLSGMDFLDLFSGTGAVGIEAASRGANAVFNDLRADSVALTRANLKKVGIRGEVTCSDAVSFIKSARKKFDIVFLDPPYKSQVIPELLNTISGVLKDDGIVVFENEHPFYGLAQGLVLTDVRRYGRAVLNFFKKQKSGAAVYAGTFDPVTKGHYDSVSLAIKAFKKVFIVVGENAKKTPFFTEIERVKLLKAAFCGTDTQVIRFSDFKSEKEYADYLDANGVKYYVRGIRDKKDFEYEKKAEKRNLSVYPFITTAYIFCEDGDRAISSTKVKNLIKSGKNALEFIPDGAKDAFAQIMREREPKI